MASISTITLPNGSEYDLKDADARAQLMSTIAGYSVSTTTGAMELWSQNLNSITKTGFYNAMTCTNAKYPYSTLIVIGYYLSGYCTQIQSDVTTGAIATRTQINGTWSSWKVLSTTVTSTYDNNGNVTLISGGSDYADGDGVSY